LVRSGAIAFISVFLWSALAAGAQGDVDIQPDPIDCWPIDEFLRVRSLFVPPENIQSAKFYFRSTAYPDYYFVELAMSAGQGSAFVPKADPATAEVAFYVEILTDEFNAFRTEEEVVPVETGSECKRRNPAAVYFRGEDPGIAVGATRPGASPIPPGFQPDGISGFLETTSGAVESTGGGSGKTIAIIAGIGGGVAGGLAIAGGGDDSSTTISTSSSTTTTAAASSSSTTSVTTTAATTSNPTTSVTTSVQLNADLRVTKSGPTSGAVGQNLNYSITVANLGPSNALGVRVIDSWTAGLANFVGSTIPCTVQSANRVRCDIGSLPAGGNVSIRITLTPLQRRTTLSNTASVALNSPADPNPSNNSQTVNTPIALTAGPSAELDMTYRSSIVVEPRNGGARGQIVVNGGSFQATDDAGEYVYQARVREGVNRIETRLDVPAGSSGTWRFDFGASPEFVSGSLRVESGRVVSQDGASIVFALGREAPPPRFTFEVGEGRRSGPR
jgi:uncharacterized repeat protein (TIGR01451 family)